MFWWLIGSLNTTIRDNAPLVIWLQGGPGAAGSGYGNFLEIGPLDINLQPREITWANAANLLFIDNPVGTGYSYVVNNTLFAKNEKEIAADLLTLWQSFIAKYPVFATNPLYIFSESYGGKMAASFAYALHEAMTHDNLTTNFKAVAMGDSWIDPISFVNAWGDYLFTTSEVNAQGQADINAAAQLCAQAVQAQNWTEATNLWGNVEEVIENVTFNIDFYNILQRNSSLEFVSLSLADRIKKHFAVNLGDIDDELATLMNGVIKAKIGIIPANVTWGGQSNEVFDHLAEDFMQSVVETVGQLLNRSIPVIPYSGNLDLICCTPGTLNWINQLEWDGLAEWNASPRKTLKVDNMIVGFKQHSSKLHLYNIMDAGHMVPADNPAAAYAMLLDVLENV